VARKCGITEEDQELEDLTLQQYIDMYKHPLSEESMATVMKLTEVAQGKQKKKKDKKKKKKE
jgi:hypothetical protein